MNGPRPRILVVDDEPQTRQVISDTLQSISAKVTTADCAQQAARMLEQNKFDVVLLDVNMPGASGLDLLDLSQRWDWDASFILMSGSPAMDSVVSAVRLRAADFLMKPIRAKTLRDSVEKAYQSLLKARNAKNHHSKIEQALSKSSSDLTSAHDSMESAQFETLRSLTAALAAREHTTYSHSYRVRAYTSHLAKLVGYRRQIWAIWNMRHCCTTSGRSAFRIPSC